LGARWHDAAEDYVVNNYGIKQKHKAIVRELNLRRRVYPRWVEQKKMSPHMAAEEIAIFESIALDYEKLIMAEAERVLL
jgi:hypothetical protein